MSDTTISKCPACNQEMHPTDYIDRLREQLAAKQARIDALMLEYCPDEMTPEQVANWAKRQQVYEPNGGK